MTFLISSREALCETLDHLEKPACVISVNSHNRERNVIVATEHVCGVLYLCFDDVNASKKHFISAEDIERLFSFCRFYWPLVDVTVLQCESGISRSSALAVALARICGQSDAFVFENPAYHPNADVYLKIMEAYREKPFFPRGIAPLAKGLFWVKDPDRCEETLIAHTILSDPSGKCVEECGRMKLSHKKVWETLERYQKGGKTFDYYPRGRVEIKKGVATVYLHPLLCRANVLRVLTDRFGLYPKNGIKRVRSVADESAHYRCLKE